MKKGVYKDHKHNPGDPEETKTLSEHAVIGVRKAKAHGKAKTHLDFHLVLDMKGDKKGFQMYKGQEGGFIKNKTYLISLMAICKKLAGLVDESSRYFFTLISGGVLTLSLIMFLWTN